MTGDRAELDSQARRWLWGFPRGLREERGEEVAGVVVDLLPPSTERLPWSSRVELVRAGLRVRGREVPPPSVWWQVLHATPRSRHGMVPDRWRPWLVRRLPTTSFLWTWALLRMLMCTLPSLVVVVWSQVDSGGNVWQLGLSWAGLLGLVAAIQVPVSGNRWRRTMRRRNGLDGLGAPLPDASVRTVARGATFPNVSIRGPLAALTLAMAVRTGQAIDRTALPLPVGERRSLVALGAALALPIAATWWARRTIRRAARAHAWAPMARRRSVRAVLGELVVLVLTGFALTQVAAIVADLATPSIGSGVVASTLGLLLGLVVVRGREGVPVGLWDLVPAAGPLLQREPIEPDEPTSPHRAVAGS